MAVGVSWYIGMRVLYIRFDDSVGHEDIAELEGMLEIWYTKGIRPVHVIVDQRDARISSEYLEQACGLLRGFALAESDGVRGWLLVIGRVEPLGALFNTLLMQMKGVRQRQFDRIGAALAFLQEHDPALPSLLITQEIA